MCHFYNYIKTILFKFLKSWRQRLRTTPNPQVPICKSWKEDSDWPDLLRFLLPGSMSVVWD